MEAESRSAARLSAEGLRKSFGPNVAVSDATFAVSSGEIVALVGSNGSGKSTLLKLIYGRLVPDAGCTRVNGSVLKAGNPHLARECGIEMVFQDRDEESKLCPGISVLENLFLGREIASRLGLLRFRKMAEHAKLVFDSYKMSVPPLDAIVGELSGGQQKAVAIGRVLLSRPSILLLDEPTTSLGISETRVVHSSISELKTAGVAIVLCSHSLSEVMDLGDQVVALRGGAIVANQKCAELHEHDVALLMSK